jgi:hypothetical protein
MRRSRGLPLGLAAFLIPGVSELARGQPLGINPSAAPSEIGNPSSINPAARASDVWNPSATNPAAAASQIPQPSTFPSGPGRAAPRSGQQSAPLPRAPMIEGAPRSLLTARQIEELRKREAESGWNGRVAVETWQELRDHLASCWTVPAGTAGSSIMLRFMISSVGELRGPPMVTATNVVPKEMSARYREAALAVLQKCLPVRPTAEFGTVLHDTLLNLRLVNDAPFPSRNLGPWMTIFARPKKGG